ncbi:glycosyltransferase family 15 protein [Exidia glandulosa HHB12029]|uniref:Glycosyltransferase family 15 protein n=1 Tax=Exidia glandulosa HHB12029 TaxID=1314781 RepID=A0A166BS24_EXIGL|nr:glycosyltransferase family 15 protein [Exidia glandulosa HHB12029]
MKYVEDRFNKKFNYPWVFLSEAPFSKQFKQATREITDANVTYGHIETSEWHQPSWIDEDRAEVSRKQLKRQRVLYAKSVTYRNMCRFNSGFIFNNKFMKNYRYYWRISPGAEYYCDVDQDPFLFMQDHKKVYGFVMSMYEYPQTIPTLWETVKNFTKAHPEYLNADNAMNFISRNGGDSYNLCHFWNNFEIVDMDFFRSEAYTKFFEHIDATGGFYYERWSDAPIHTIAVSLFANRSQIHFFDDMGYRHEPYQHCPQGEAHSRGKCMCIEKNTFDNSRFSCLKQYLAMDAH